MPAGLYCLYNNLQFVNLAAYDPTTYYLLLQFRVVVTGVVFQVYFKTFKKKKQKTKQKKKQKKKTKQKKPTSDYKHKR